MVKPQSPRRLWRVVLVVSLCLNLALIGMIAGAAFSGKAMGGPPSRVSFGLGPVTDALDRDDRRAIAREVRGRMGNRVARRADMQSLVDVLIADPFDPDALHDLIRSQSQQAAEVVSSAQAAFVMRVNNMTPDQRAALAQRITKGRRR